jgi:hypothetical protein
MICRIDVLLPSAVVAYRDMDRTPLISFVIDASTSHLFSFLLFMLCINIRGTFFLSVRVLPKKYWGEPADDTRHLEAHDRIRAKGQTIISTKVTKLFSCTNESLHAGPRILWNTWMIYHKRYVFILPYAMFQLFSVMMCYGFTRMFKTILYPATTLAHDE